MNTKGKIDKMNIAALLFLIISILSQKYTYTNSTVNNNLLGTNDNIQQEITQTSGYDFSLPDYTNASMSKAKGLLITPNFDGNPSENAQKAVKGKLVTLSWSELNPQENVYNWNYILNELEQDQTEKKPLVFRLKVSTVFEQSPYRECIDVCDVPLWVLNKYGVDINNPQTGVADMGYTNGTIKVVVPWHQGIQTELDHFIDTLSSQGFQESALYRGLYIHGISSATGEELNIDTSAFQYLTNEELMTANYVMTPDRYFDAFKHRLDQWVSAFGENKHKLAWVHAGNIGASGHPDSQLYYQKRDELNDYAKSLEIGIREGGIEDYSRYIGDNLFGQTLSDDNYISRIDNDHYVATDVYFGEENEQFAQESYNQYMYMVSTLRALQMGIKTLWVNLEQLDTVDPQGQISNYFVKTAARGIRTSPDAWTFLWQLNKRNNQNECIGYKNLEKWLHQRNIPGAMTTPTRWQERKAFGKDCNTDQNLVNGDYTAIKTDISNAQNRIGFYLDDGFIRSTGYYELKVTYEDSYNNDFGTSWKVNYCTNTGVAETPTVTGINKDNTLKTATINLSNLITNNCLNNTFDLEIVPTNEQDITVSFVRLIKK